MDRTPSAVPVFPLPDLVLFPRTRVPLHVFELRYRTMVRDALSRGRVLALATLCPGWEQDYHGSPEFHPLGCLARIQEIEWLPNDRYDLVLEGTTRVRFGRIVSEFPYRSARIEPLPQHPYAEDDPIVTLEKQALLEQLERVWRAVEERSASGASIPPPPRLGDGDPYEQVVNAACTACGGSAVERLTLLEKDSVIERGLLVRALLERLLAALTPPPSASPEGGSERN